MRRLRLSLSLLCLTLHLPLGAAYGQGIIEPLESEEQAETAPETEAEVKPDQTVPPPYTPPAITYQQSREGIAGPPLPNLSDLPSLDPEIFFDPSAMPGPLPPPPNVTIQARPGTKFADIQADLIIQDRVEELVTLEGNVVVTYEDTIVRAAQGFLDEKHEVAMFWGEGGVEVESKDGVLNTLDLTLEYADDVKKLTAVGEVKALVYAKELKPLPAKPTRRQKLENALRERETTLTGDTLHYWWGTKEFHLWVEPETPGVATIIQEGRTAKARDIHYVKTPDEQLVMDGAVELWQVDGQWLYTHDLVEKKDSKLLKALLAVASTLTCDRLLHEEHRKLTHFDGAVHWKQADKEAKAAKVILDDSPRVWEDPAENPPAIMLVGQETVYLTPQQVREQGVTFRPGAFVDEEGTPSAEAADLEAIPPSEYGGQVLIAEGAVWGQQTSGDWLFTYEVIEPDEDEKVKEDARRPAEGWAERVVVRLDTEDLEAEGNVRVRQPHQWSRADAISYEKGSDQLTLTGEVQMRRRDKQMVLADLGILHLSSDVFEAYGHVESALIVNTDDQKPSDIEGGVTLSPLPGESAHTLRDPNVAEETPEAPAAEAPTDAAPGGDSQGAPASGTSAEEEAKEAESGDPAATDETSEPAKKSEESGEPDQQEDQE